MKRDLRYYAKQTNIRLIVGGIFILFVIGDGLIYFLYGAGAALMGLLCLGLGMIPILSIIGFLALMDWIVKNANKQQ